MDPTFSIPITSILVPIFIGHSFAAVIAATGPKRDAERAYDVLMILLVAAIVAQYPTIPLPEILRDVFVNHWRAVVVGLVALPILDAAVLRIRAMRSPAPDGPQP